MANGIADMGNLELDLDRDIFLRGLMHELAGTLEIFVRLPEAAGFISGAVAGRPSLCMMASSACGAIAAENTGYAKVVPEKTIAQGSPECRITVYLRPTSEAQAAKGREYRPNS